MTTTVLRPNGTELNTGSATTVPSGTLHAVTSDDSDSTYVQGVSSSRLEFNLTSKTFTTGEITKSCTIRARQSVASGQLFVGLSTTSPSFTTVAALVDINITSSISTTSTAAIPLTMSQAVVDGLVLDVDTDVSTPVRLYELYVDLVTVAKPVTVVTPVSPDPYTTSSTLLVKWSNTLDADGGGQTHYQVQVTDDDDDDAVVYDSGEVVDSVTAASVGPLTNGNYTLKVRVAQTVNGSLHWSDYSTDAFTVTLSTSVIASVVGTADDANGVIDVVATLDDPTAAWGFIEVERSFDAGASWSPVRTATLVDSSDSFVSFSVTDHEVPNGQATVYRARATYLTVPGDFPIVGAWTESASVSWSSSTVEWLKNPLYPTQNFAIESVRWNTQRRSNRAGVFHPLGVADAVVVSDVRTSPSGSIMIRVRGQAEALSLDAMLDSEGVLLLNLLPDSLIGPGRDGFMYIGMVTDDEDWQRQFYADGEPEERLVTLNFVQTARPPDATAGTL